MNGFVAQAENAPRGCFNTTNPARVTNSSTDVMGYHTGSDIPNFWAYARNFMLQDHMFEQVHSWSFPSHLYLVSVLVGQLHQAHRPADCTSSTEPRLASRRSPPHLRVGPLDALTVHRSRPVEGVSAPACA